MSLASSSPLPEIALQRERSMLIAGISDFLMTLVVLAAAIMGNSLILGAETIRGSLLLALEMVLLLLLRRIHRQRTHEYDYGAGKLEQFANLGIGSAMGLAAIWVGATAAYRWWYPPQQEELGLVFAVVVGAANVLQNGYAFLGLWRAGRDGTSLIISGQVRTRLTKLVSSAIVLVALAVNAFAGSGRVGHLAEVVGSAFVAIVMLQLAIAMWRDSLPSLLDRTLDEAMQTSINRALSQHFEAYDDLQAVRSRLSGNTAMIEVVLGFDAGRQIGDIQAVVDRVAEDVRTLIPGAAVLVIPVAAAG